MYYYKQQTNRVKIPQNEKTYMYYEMRKVATYSCLKFL